MTQSKEPNAQEKTESPDVDREEDALPVEQTRIIIRPGGEVVIENLSEDMLELALELGADDDDLTCSIDDADSATEREDEEDEEDKEDKEDKEDTSQIPTDGDDDA